MTQVITKMYGTVAVEGEATLKEPEELPAVAKAYVLRVMRTSFPEMNLRYRMDLRLYATILDHLLKKRYKELGDLVAQQLKATEQALEDKGF